MRPGAYFDSDVSAVIRFHCTKNKIPIAQYVRELVINDLTEKYPHLMTDIKNTRQSVER